MLLKDLTRISPEQYGALKKLKIDSAEKLLRHFPLRYGSVAEAVTIGSLEAGMRATLFGRIRDIKTKKAFRSKVPMAEATIEDDTGTMKAVWFSQAYMAKMYPEGSLVRLEGEVKERNGAFSMANPHIESVSKVPDGVGDSLFEGGTDEAMHSLYPVYSESKGITSNWIYHTVQKIFASSWFANLEDPLPQEVLDRYNLPSQKTAFVWMHAPQKKGDAEAARKRFGFEEIFLIQVKKQKERRAMLAEKPFVVDIAAETIEKFVSRFPFKLTTGQTRAIEEIKRDFASGAPMSRLLEGDVGSGKTAIAAATCYATTMTRPMGADKGRQTFGHLQTAYMVPTEILAKQHFDSFIEYFSHLPINIGLLTSSVCRKFPSKVGYARETGNGSTAVSRATLLKWVANGEVPILIGTHALIQKSVKFKHLAYVIIDEQHRFGMAQRKKLAQKNSSGASGGLMPHLLSMTATPIPRTLALTLYGDLDLTVLSEMPAGRKKVTTEIIMPKDREKAYARMRIELKAGRQAYVICPRIYEPDPEKEMKVNAVSAVEEAKRLKKEIFPEYRIEVMHGKMKPSDKDEAMRKFSEGEADILVSTSVVEVGVNVPNATVMLIEGSERFGLSQLHQLRGRVIRSNDQAYCFVLSETSGEKTVERLQALKTAASGFELAELDLKLRGAGSLSGGSQWGVTDVGMNALQNLRLVSAARDEAKALVESDPELTQFPVLKKLIDEAEEVHFE